MNKPKESAASKVMFHGGLTILLGIAVTASSMANLPGASPGFSYIGLIASGAGLWFAMRAPD